MVWLWERLLKIELEEFADVWVCDAKNKMSMMTSGFWPKQLLFLIMLCPFVF